MALWNTVNELLTTDVDADMLEYASVSQTQSAKKPNRGSFLNAASHALKISKTHSKLMKQFPTSNNRLDSWIRSLCFHLKISLFTGLDTTSQEFPGTPYKLTVTEKIVIGFLFVNSIPNTYLAAHFAKLAWDRKIPSADLLKAQRNSKLSVEEAQTFTELVHILTPRIALRDSSHYDISPLLLPASQNNPDIVLEVVTVLGTFALLHRYTAFWDDDCGLEPEVKKLMDEEYAKDLGLAGSDFSANCSDGSKPRNVTGFSNFSAQPKEPKIWGGGIKYD
ncbi:hypothetical protein BDR26DRAFT_858222 [Obelidium mucronatum]|nr:hypothetical protein BDR26DRAFT_858222 [Obelidium mucronatum]